MAGLTGALRGAAGALGEPPGPPRNWGPGGADPGLRARDQPGTEGPARTAPDLRMKRPFRGGGEWWRGQPGTCPPRPRAGGKREDLRRT